jgi:hypothetical protein
MSGHNYTIRRMENGVLFGPVLTEEEMLKRKSLDIFAVPN